MSLWSLAHDEDGVGESFVDPLLSKLCIVAQTGHLGGLFLGPLTSGHASCSGSCAVPNEKW